MMDQEDLLSIKTNENNIIKFIEKYNQKFQFPELDKNNLREELWSTIFSYLENKQYRSIYTHCLTAIKILSRDKDNLDKTVKESWINTLIELCSFETLEKEINVQSDYNVIIEALKCLCNLIFNSTVVLNLCCSKGIFEGIMKRILTYWDPAVPYELKYFDIKLLFIMTALCADIRPKLRDGLHAVTYLMEMLDVILKECPERQEPGSHRNELVLNDNQVNLSCEILKVLYNLTVKNQFVLNVDEDEETQFIRLVVLLHDFLLASTESTNKKIEMQGHIVNLLTVVPTNCLKHLITTQISLSNQQLPKQFLYEGYNIEVLDILLTFLKKRLNTESSTKGQNELLSPILIVLLNCANSSRIMRKYLRMQILPPLRDVRRRPEEGSTLRNHLCRMLTTPVTELRDVAAELLFVLCKENVARMIKYTGYGNAAGLFANRGLLPRGHITDLASVSKYSSDSEDSDTEEYKQLRHGINDVLGCYEPPRAAPTAHLTEEQKEVEAMKLVQLMHDLTEKGVIRPCCLDEDGRPQPLEHVLQLQDQLSTTKTTSTSDKSS